MSLIDKNDELLSYRVSYNIKQKLLDLGVIDMQKRPRKRRQVSRLFAVSFSYPTYAGQDPL